MTQMYGREKATGLGSRQILIGLLGIRNNAHVNVADYGAAMFYGIAIDKKVINNVTQNVM